MFNFHNQFILTLQSNCSLFTIKMIPYSIKLFYLVNKLFQLENIRTYLSVI